VDFLRFVFRSIPFSLSSNFFPLTPYMKLQIYGTANRRIFVIRFFKVSFLRFDWSLAARGGAET